MRQQFRDRGMHRGHAPSPSAGVEVLVVIDAADPDFLHGVQQYALLHPGLRPRVHLIEYSRTEDLRQIGRILNRYRPAGVLAPVTGETRRFVEKLDVPVVNPLDTLATKLPTVMHDQAAVGRLAAEHLIGQGLENLAYLSAARGLYSRVRWEGFSAAARAAGVPCRLFDDEHAVPMDRAIPESLVRRWLGKLPRPLGVHAANAALALKVVWVCGDMGLRVPQDVAVLAGQDRPHLSTTWEPTLSAFDLSRQRLALACMALLDRMVHGEAPPKGPVVLEPGPLIQRQSTDVRAVSDPEVAAALRLIRQSAHRPISVKEIIQQVQVSRSTLEHRFSAAMGRTLHDEIVRVHMERAKTLLAQSVLSVEQVARQSGFSGGDVFAVAFRKFAGMTPTEYRGTTQKQ